VNEQSNSSSAILSTLQEMANNLSICQQTKTNMYILLFIVFMGLSLLVSQTLKVKFRKYSQVPVNLGLTGRDIAQKMLRENGIYDVQVVSVEGQLTDHYNPQTRTVNLSPEVYNNSSIAAAAVAAHECGHAVQHAQAYSFLQMRSPWCQS
jgi:Zn-dependent membrane protease YugP